MASPASEDRSAATKPPNMLILITDQQRQPRHWPDEPGWLTELMPNDAELARTGLSFTNGYCNTAMCSPSRATLFSGRYPAEHGVELTLTAADLRPANDSAPAVLKEMGGILRSGEASLGRVLPQFARGALGLDRSSGGETELPTGLPTLATLLRERGYHVAYKGKWHLTHPSGREDADSMLGGWTAADGERLERDYGFASWEPPDAGENAKASNFGGGNAGMGEGWDEVYTGQAERWLAQEELPEPFCLVVSLVNPHDVLGYPAQYEDGGYVHSDFRDLGVELPPTFDETLRNKPAVHALMRMGMAAYLGPLSDAQSAARLRQLLRPPAPHRRREDRSHPGRARRPFRSGLAALEHGGRALRRPRRDGPLPRRPAAEGLQRLRGDDQRADRHLQPGALPGGRRDRRLRLARRPAADAAQSQRRRRSAGRRPAR